MEQTHTTPGLSELFGEVIHRYTRAQAIEDGALVDLMAAAPGREEVPGVCRQHFKHPIACTAAVFELIDRAVKNPRYCNDYAGVVHDVLWMARTMGRKLDGSTVLFRVIIQGAGRQKYHDLKLVVGPGDNLEPVITILLPHED